MKLIRAIFLCLSVSLVLASAQAATIYVATNGNDTTGNGSQTQPYLTIQKGIDEALNNDTVVVKNGTYTGQGNVNLEFRNKDITVKSQNGAGSCIIDCEDTADTRGFIFYSGEGPGSVVDGFTIQNGNFTVGGGIYCWRSGPTLKNNIITGNWAGYGGGIFFENNSSPVIANNTIIGNSALYAAGIGFQNSSPTIDSNIIAENSAEYGGGIGCAASPVVTLTNNVIARNSAVTAGGGLGCDSSFMQMTNNTFTGNSAEGADAIGCYSSTVVMVNTIVWEDDLEGIYLGPSNSLTISYSDVKGGPAGINSDGSSTVTWLSGNINSDPLFVNAPAGNYHLSNSSPCIGGGTSSGAPADDIEGNIRPNPVSSNPDIGAYESPLGQGSSFNNIPVAYDQSITTDEDASVSITLTGNDIDGDTLDYTVVDYPINGLLTGTAPNLTYAPDPGFSGLDSFTFKVNDSEADSNIATVNIIVGGSLIIQAFSPVDLTVMDPQGNTIDKNGSTIPSATYSEVDVNGDGDIDDKIVIPDPLTGVYSIAVTPETGAALTDTYTLEVLFGSYSALLAENVQVQNIPAELYGFLFQYLVEGWDLISIPLQPPNTTPSVVLSSIAGRYSSVWAFNPNTSWTIYSPNTPSSLVTVEPNRGYWIRMELPGALIVHGVDPAQTAIFLQGGEWNLAGYSARMPKSAVDAMQSVAGSINSVWEYNPGAAWSIYLPGGASNLVSMKPGRGYWIKADLSCIWDVNAP